MTMNLRNFFSEVKRRNIYKVAIAYGVIAWLLMQIATQVFPFLQIPNWAIRLVIMLLALGFPIALIIAWAFEATPGESNAQKSQMLRQSALAAARGFTLYSSARRFLSVCSFSADTVRRRERL